MKTSLISYILFLLFTLFSVATSSQPQELRLYNDTECQIGSIVGETHINPDIIELPDNLALKDIKSVSVVGLWKLNGCLHSGNCLGRNDTDPIHAAEGPLCIAQNFTNSAVENMTRVYIQRFGEASQTGNRFHVFSGKDLGDREGSFTGTVSKNPLGFDEAGSFFLSGTQNWTVFPEAQFQGMGECFQPESAVIERGFGFTIHLNSAMKLGSVMEGCHPGEWQGDNAGFRMGSSSYPLALISILCFALI